MWIIPSTHPLYQFAPDCVASKEDLNAHWGTLSVSPLMWKSKPLSLKTFWRQWKRVWWMRHLSGRILKPSMQNIFTEKLAASLADIHAPGKVSRGSGSYISTTDSFGRIYAGLSMQAPRKDTGQTAEIEIVKTISESWPAPPGGAQHSWEAPRTIKPGMGCTVDGYNFREDLLRAFGNSVVEQTAEIAFRDLLKKFI